MASRQPAPQGRRSWRESPARTTATPTRGSKTPLRVLMTLVVAALLAAFLWFLWQPTRPEPPTHFVALLTGESDMLSMPPILFEQETVKPLRDFAEESEVFSYPEASESQSTDSLADMQKWIDNLDVAEEDRLIVYVSAHGVSERDQAYVLAADYNLQNPAERRYSAQELIEKVANLKTAATLVVFDCTRLAVHPRLGMAANEFARLVEEAAKRTEAPHMAILLAASDWGVSPLGLAQGKSVLGEALTEAITGVGDAGDPDADQDGNLSLGELREFVKKQCAAARVAAPVPQLVFCKSETPDRERENLVILRLPSDEIRQKVRDRNKPDEPPSAKPATTTAGVAKSVLKAAPGQALAAAGATALPAQASPGAQPAAGGAPPGAPAAPAANPPAAATADGGASAPSPGPPAATDPAAGAGGADEGGPTSSSPAATAPPASAPGPAPAATPPSTGPPATGPSAAGPGAAKPSTIMQAWQLRDRLSGADADASQAALPVDYAPHIWNELNAKLVALNLEQLGRPKTTDAAAADDQIKPYVRGMQSLVDGADAAHDGVLTDQLNVARRNYAGSDQWQSLQIVDERYRQALLHFRRALVHANQVLQWHAAGLGTPGNAETITEIEKYLHALGSLDGTLAQFEIDRFESADKAGPTLRQIKTDDETVSLVAARIARLVEREVAAIVSDPDAAAQREIEALLTTDLATADQRKTLETALKNQAGSSALESPPWRDLVEHLRLEIQFVQLIDPAQANTEAFEALTKSSRENRTSTDEQLTLVRAAGLALRKFYADLPTRISVLQQAGSSKPDLRAAERMMAALHPRDAASLTGAESGFVAARQKPPAEIGVRAETPLVKLREGDWTPVTWKLTLPAGANPAVTATLADFDAQALQVRFPDSDDPATLNATHSFGATAPEAITLLVRPREAQNGTDAARTKSVMLRVSVELESGPRNQLCPAKVLVPLPNRIDMQVRTIDPATLRRETPAKHRVEIRPYANRTTTFGFDLVNYTGEKKNLRVELFAVPALQGPDKPFVDGGWPPGRLIDEQGNRNKRLEDWVNTDLAQASSIASCDAFALESHERPQTVKFVPPAPPTPAETPAAAADGAAPAPPAPAPPATDVTYGLVCRLTDLDHPRDAPILKWLEVVPLRPLSYFDFDKPQPAANGISFTAHPSDVNDDRRRDKPPEIAEKPVKFRIRGDDTVFAKGGIVSEDYKGAEDPRLEVQPLAGLLGPRTISMDVDGVPRAVTWEVIFDRRLPPDIKPNQTMKSIRMLRVGMPGIPELIPPRLYQTRPHVDFPVINPEVWGDPVDVGDDRACSFNVSQGERPPVWVRLQVDAPEDSFLVVGDGSHVKVWWDDDESTSYNLYYDRYVHSEVPKWTDAGEMLVTSTVDDFEFPLTPPAVNNDRVTLTAELFTQGERRVDELEVVFDQTPPRISVAGPQSPVWLGTPTINVRLQVEDLSSIERVEVWFLPEMPSSDKELPPKTDYRRDAFEQRPRQPDEAQARAFTLQVKPPAKVGVYYMVVRVTDRSGQSNTTLPIEHPIRVEEKKAPVAAPVIGDVKGKVIVGTKPAPAGLKVAVENNAALFGTTGAGGAYVIPQVPPGEYKLIVSGSAGNYPVNGEGTVKLEKLADYQRAYDIPASVVWSKPKEE